MSELLDLRKEDGSRKGETKERELVHRDGDLHGTSHVWLVRYRADRGSADVLLQKRSAHKDSFRAVMTSLPRDIFRQDRISGIGAAGASGRAGRKS